MSSVVAQIQRRHIEVSRMISVCVCDPQPIVRHGLASVLEGSEQFAFADSTSTLSEALEQFDGSSVGILVLDRSFGMHALVEAIDDVRRLSPRTEVVIWAGSISDVESFRLLQAGARGVLRKTAEIHALIHCFQTVAKKQIWTDNLVTDAESPLGRPRTRPLTPREQQVAELVSKGMKNREIAEALSIATGTVKIHLMHIFEKTGIRDRFELALHGLRLACAPESSLPAKKPAQGSFSPLRTLLKS
jgi:DNA-binding NarL/FixJ family response regulator